LQAIIRTGIWSKQDPLAISRSENAIQKTAVIVDCFRNAQPCGPPLWGIQQIPSRDAEKRAMDVAVYGTYGIMEIVKGCSAVTAARKFVTLVEGINDHHATKTDPFPHKGLLKTDRLAQNQLEYASNRDYPPELCLF